MIIKELGLEIFEDLLNFFEQRVFVAHGEKSRCDCVVLLYS
jgi:hypothetical protein